MSALVERLVSVVVIFFKQKTAYEMRISNWSSDVCSSDLVAAIRQEMEAIKREVGVKGTLEQFFDHIRTDPKLKYPNTAAGREAYLTDARAVIASAMAAAPRYFSVLPKAALEVRAVDRKSVG